MFKNVITGPRGSGKSRLLSRLIADAALEDNQNILVAGYIGGQFISHYIIDHLNKLNINIEDKKGNYIQLENGTTIYFIGFQRHFAKGCKIDLLAIDQGDELPLDTRAALMPCLKQGGALIETRTHNV